MQSSYCVQPRTAVESNAFPRNLFDCQTGVMCIWNWCSLWRSKFYVLPTVSIPFVGYISFTSAPFLRWLGQNSKQNKLSRQLGDVQIRMRLKVSADKPEIRQTYIPALFPHLVKPLMNAAAVREPYLVLQPLY